jgi:hypothetical protein
VIPGFAVKRAANLDRHGIDLLRAVQVFEGFVSRQLDTRQMNAVPHPHMLAHRKSAG